MNSIDDNTDKSVMLKAVWHNWGLTKAGDVFVILWEVYYDRTYTITSFISVWDPESDGLPDYKGYVERGEMEQVSFDNLRVLAEKKPWRTLNHEIRACDGAAWNIKLYSYKGALLNSSGCTYYIYGEEVLEKIVDALPDKKENRFENYKDVKESYLMSYEKFVQLFKQE